MNTVEHGDCLDFLSNMEPNSVNLIYLDPPFFTQRKHSLTTRDRSKEYSVSDSWDSLDAYLAFIKERIPLMQ